MQVVEYPLKTDMLESCGHLVKVIKVINVFAISRNIHFFFWIFVAPHINELPKRYPTTSLSE
jgi:hypothetical protein